jgi:S-(hydroxymethyl)glutathione dehydrogenase/alcohol dehydrogenase
MKTTAAVLVATGQPLEIAELEIPTLQTGQVLVRIVYSGVCHTQLLECRGHRGADPYLPHCLGHEGSGYVCDIAPGVSKVKVDDRVALSWIKGSGADAPATVYSWGQRKVNAGGITTFMNYAVISENRLTAMRAPISMQQTALLGCAVSTGAGAVLNTVHPEPGQSIAIFGTGGVGLFAVAAAVLKNCAPVIAIDILENKLALARQVGATHSIDAAEQDPVERIHEICPAGVDYAIEASGRPNVMRQALDCVRPQGGGAVIIGNARAGEQITLDPGQLNRGKHIYGTWGGDTVPDRDLPRYAALIEAGKLPTAPVLSRSYTLSEINRCLDELETGQVARPVIAMDHRG